MERTFGGNRLRSVTTTRLNGYLADRLDEGAAPSTVKKELAALRRAFNLLAKEGRVSSVPSFPSVAIDNTREGFFTRAQLDRLLVELPEHVRGPTQFGALTGWRKGEILALQWSAVDFENGVVRLAPGTTKNREGREFPFAALPALRELLEGQRAATRTLERETGRLIPWVFHRAGRRVRSFYKAWNSACQRAGLEGWVFHDLRRTAVRDLERAGVSRSVATKLTGHKTEAVYKRYAIVDSAALAEGVERLAASRKIVPINRAG